MDEVSRFQRLVLRQVASLDRIDEICRVFSRVLQFEVRLVVVADTHGEDVQSWFRTVATVMKQYYGRVTVLSPVVFSD